MTIQDVQIGSSYVDNIFRLKKEIEKVEQLLEKDSYGWSEFVIKDVAYSNKFDLQPQETGEILKNHLNHLRKELKDNEDILAKL